MDRLMLALLRLRELLAGEAMSIRILDHAVATAAQANCEHHCERRS